MQKLNDGIGDLKQLTLVQPKKQGAEDQPTALPRRHPKIVRLFVALLLTWGALDFALSEILVARSLH